MSTNPTVAEYVVSRIAALGIDHVFGVPGDYAFPWNDAIEANGDVQWVSAANELNAAYAADGYARVRGAAMLCTTFGPGELSAINGVMGAMAESVPIFWLVGLPSSQLRRDGRILHHMLRTANYELNAQICQQATVDSVELTPENAVEQLELIIGACLKHRKPVYINVPQDLAYLPIVGDPVVGVQLAQVPLAPSDPAQLRVVKERLRAALATAKNPVALPSYLVARYGLSDKFTEFVDTTGIAFATGRMDKAVISETNDQFLGMYSGIGSSPGVKAAVEGADLVLDFDFCFSDENSGAWTSTVDPAKQVIIGADFVKIGPIHATPVNMKDTLDALIEVSPRFDEPRLPKAEEDEPTCLETDRVSSAAFYPRLAKFLRPGDIVVSETGLSNLKLGDIWMPEGVTFLNQPLWGSIGWATPAAFGAAIADRDRRVVLVTGDGSHQMTANELGVMGRYGVNPVIFVLNNELYGIEELVADESRSGNHYNRIALWNYAAVPAALGCRDWNALKVRTIGELDAAMASVSTSDSATLIEVDLGVADVPTSLPTPFLNQMYGLTPTEPGVPTLVEGLAALEAESG